jgi:hypothetical protein
MVRGQRRFDALRLSKACQLAGLMLTLALGFTSTATAAPPGYHECSSRYWGAGAMNVSVKNIGCSSAHYVLLGGLDRHLNLRRGGFKCHRERNAENVVWLYWCYSGPMRLFFNTY